MKDKWEGGRIRHGKTSDPDSSKTPVKEKKEGS